MSIPNKYNSVEIGGTLHYNVALNALVGNTLVWHWNKVPCEHYEVAVWTTEEPKSDLILPNTVCKIVVRNLLPSNRYYIRLRPFIDGQEPTYSRNQVTTPIVPPARDRYEVTMKVGEPVYVKTEGFIQSSALIQANENLITASGPGYTELKIERGSRVESLPIWVQR